MPRNWMKGALKAGDVWSTSILHTMRRSAARLADMREVPSDQIMRASGLEDGALALQTSFLVSSRILQFASQGPFWRPKKTVIGTGGDYVTRIISGRQLETVAWLERSHLT